MNAYTHPSNSMTVSLATPVDRLTRWELYRLLAEPARLRLMALAGEEELAVSELAELLGEVQPNVSRHVASLRPSGVLQVRRQGTWTLVRLAEGADADAVDACGAVAGDPRGVGRRGDRECSRPACRDAAAAPVPGGPGRDRRSGLNPIFSA